MRFLEPAKHTPGDSWFIPRRFLSRAAGAVKRWRRPARVWGKAAALALALPAPLAAADTNTLEAFRLIIEGQSRQIAELNEKVRRLEARDAQRETNPPAPLLPAIVIDTNGAPVASLAKVEAAAATNRPLATLELGEKGFSFRSADTNFILTLHGLAQADLRAFFDGNAVAPADGGFLVRRARPIFEGTVFRDYDFLIAPDFAGSSPQLYDAHVTARFLPGLQLRVGKFKGPVSLENLQSDAAAPFNERSLAANLAPMRNLGAQLSGSLLQARLGWAAGVYNATGDGRLSGNNPAGGDLEYAGRLFAEPFLNHPDSRLRGLGFGVGGSYSQVSSNSAALPATTGGSLPGYVTTGQQQFFAYNPLLGPVVADGAHWRLAPQGYYHLGPFGLQGEYVFSEQGLFNSTTLRDTEVMATAWQITAQWVLTGEKASFNGIQPAKPFNPLAGQWGAWQLVARYSELAIDDSVYNGFANRDTSARGAAAWTVGVNWWLTSNVRWLTSFSHTAFRGGGGVNLLDPNAVSAPATVAAQAENALFTRLQIAF